MKPLIIVGAGGHGQEVVWLAQRCNRIIRGFLDDTVDKLGKSYLGVQVLGPIDHYEQYLDCEFIVAIGNCRYRSKLVNKLESNPNISFATLIDPQSIIGCRSVIGSGSMICAGSILTVDVDIGRHCIVNVNASISHGCKIGNFSTIAPNASISGDVVLEDKVEVGANAVIKEKVIIGKGTLIGMGAVVVKNIDQNNVMIGNPAKLLKKLDY